jgi:hypothetical protein
MKRFFCKTNAYNCVVFVDENGKGFMIYENLFDEELTIDVAKNSDYSNLDGCKTAEECAYSIGTPQAEPRTASHTATQLTKAE